MKTTLSRREALVALAAVTLAACKPGGARPPGLLALTADLGLSAVAKAFVAAYPKESRVEALVASLPDPKGQSTDALRAEVSKRATADYAAGRVFTADGWVMSRTEGALATLAHYDALIHG